MKTQAAQTLGPVAADVAGELAGAEREPDQGDVAQIELVSSASRSSASVSKS